MKQRKCLLLGRRMLSHRPIETSAAETYVVAAAAAVFGDTAAGRRYIFDMQSTANDYDV